MKINTLALAIALFGAFLGAVSQYMLKLSAKKYYENRLMEYLNPLVISAYLIFFLISFANLYSLRYLPVSLMPMIEATSYVHVGLIAHFMLKERIGTKKLIGIILIISGIVIASL